MNVTVRTWDAEPKLSTDESGDWVDLRLEDLEVTIFTDTDAAGGDHHQAAINLLEHLQNEIAGELEWLRQAQVAASQDRLPHCG